ncbi:MAG TPA: hypothetical protein VGR71_16705 [Nitrospira sp.]|nr:hypothetical protein [Nitrospira sp.]
MPEQVSECPYCHGTFLHQGPTGCPPVKWPPEPQHTQSESPVEICWLMDVRKYGIEVANRLHP